MVLPVKGSFIQHFLDGKRVVAEPSQALFFKTGRPFQISHSIAEKDECLAFEFSSEIWKEVVQSSDRVPDFSLLSSRAIAERTLLWKRLSAGWTDDVGIVAESFGLVSSALSNTVKQLIRKSNRRLEQIEAVKLALLKMPDKKWSLSALAQLVKLSPYHLTRIFKRHVGTSLHQYHLRVRIAETICAIVDTKSDLTQIALDYGFSSHSHFTATFRKMIGWTPADFRKVANSSMKKEMRKKLIAH